MCGSEDWQKFANERRLLSYLLDECASSQFKPGKSWFAPVLHLVMTSECKYTAWFSRLVILLQFVFNLSSKLRWFPACKWVKFVPKSRWIDVPTARQQQKLIENKDSALPPMKEWNERTFSLSANQRAHNTKFVHFGWISLPTYPEVF